MRESPQPMRTDALGWAVLASLALSIPVTLAFNLPPSSTFLNQAASLIGWGAWLLLLTGSPQEAGSRVGRTGAQGSGVHILRAAGGDVPRDSTIGVEWACTAHLPGLLKQTAAPRRASAAGQTLRAVNTAPRRAGMIGGPCRSASIHCHEHPTPRLPVRPALRRRQNTRRESATNIALYIVPDRRKSYGASKATAA